MINHDPPGFGVSAARRYASRGTVELHRRVTGGSPERDSLGPYRKLERVRLTGEFFAYRPHDRRDVLVVEQALCTGSRDRRGCRG
jgi:hypothetical protein